ncbi:uncharacterized protein LOC143471346 isoform X1 [Clavelina lepadiformis]|uniref:uncharacterized protein LOC143471346 isoform X1 n=1 Tax=Clavelina lepadiformis TaxID=159417 RepID=UPI00404300BD
MKEWPKSWTNHTKLFAVDNTFQSVNLELSFPYKVALGVSITLGPLQTLMNLFEAWKGFVAKMDIYTQDIQTATFRYFKYLKVFSVDHQVNIVQIARKQRRLDLICI